MVDLDPQRAARARASRRATSSTRISAQNLILPAGTAKIGDVEYDVELNSSPQTRRRS